MLFADKEQKLAEGEYGVGGSSSFVCDGLDSEFETMRMITLADDFQKMAATKRDNRFPAYKPIRATATFSELGEKFRDENENTGRKP